MGLFNQKQKKLRKSREGKLLQILTKAEVSVFLDVGANIGQTHEKMRAVGFKGKIVSFDPVPSCHAELERKARHDPNWIIAPRMALGAQKGEIDMHISEATDMSSALPPSAELLKALPKTKVVECVPTPMNALDDIFGDYCTKDDNVFLKMDTQGFERNVLNGAKETLKKIVGIQMELSLFSLYEGEETYLTYLQDLHKWGFKPYMIDETNFSRPLARQLQIDVIFMRT